MREDIAAAPALPWSDSFSVGVEPLDADHRALVQQINVFCVASSSGWHAQALQTLDSLYVLAGEHFEREEAVLRALSGYREAAAHASSHRNRLKQLTDLVQCFRESDDAGMQRQLCSDLIDWFVRQSIGHDAAIKAYFDDHGTRLAGRLRGSC
jgi:hemerythrin